MSERRKLFGPPNTIIPSSGVLNADEDTIISDRSNDDVRKFFVKTGVSSNASGSCYLEVGQTILEVSIFGPRPIRGSFIERASFSVSTRFLPHINQPNEAIFNTQNTNGKANSSGIRGGLSNVEQRISSYVETSLLPSVMLEKYPKSTIDCFVNVIAVDDFSNEDTIDNGPILNLVSWITNCTSLALVDSGIELRDIVTCGHVKLTDNQLVFDPSTATPGSIDCLVSFMNLKNDEIVGLWIEGKQDVDEDKLETLLEGCNTVSKKVRSNINSFLLSTIKSA